MRGLRARATAPTIGAAAALIACSLFVAGMIVPSGTAAASAGDQAQIAELRQRIAAQGARVKSLVSRYNDVQAEVTLLDAQVARDESVLLLDERAETATKLALRRVALQAYITNSGMDSATLALLASSATISTTLSQNQYLDAVDNQLGDALRALRGAQARTELARSDVRSKQARAKASLRDLARARDAASSAIASDEAILRHVSGDVRNVLVAADDQRRAAQQASERALAAPLPSPTSKAPASGPPLPPAPPPAPPAPLPPPPPSRGYANPLRDITALTPERIDQGVDYAGFGSIYAIGNGVVLNTVGNGWPGGTFIAYRLTDGPAAGLVVYAAEDIAPSVQVGDTVTSDTVLGHMYAGPDGIETGWADPDSLPDTMARTYGQYDGSNVTAFGLNFSWFLRSVGAPGGVQNGPPTGHLPATWPRW